MKEKIIDIDNTVFFSYENMLTRFKRAKSEDTLDTMYRGAVSIHRNSIDTGKMRRSSLDPTFLLA